MSVLGIFIRGLCKSLVEAACNTAIDAKEQRMTLYKRQDATDMRLLGCGGGGGGGDYTRQVASACDHVTLKNPG